MTDSNILPSYYSNNEWEQIASLDLDEPDYSFDLLTVWKNKKTGKFVYATDSGCSCPTPFEDHTADDFKDFSWSAVESTIAEEGKGTGGYPKPTDVAAFKDALKKAGL